MANYTLHMIWNLFGKEHSNTFNWEKVFGKWPDSWFCQTLLVPLPENYVTANDRRCNFFLLIDKRAWWFWGVRDGRVGSEVGGERRKRRGAVSMILNSFKGKKYFCLLKKHFFLNFSLTLMRVRVNGWESALGCSSTFLPSASLETTNKRKLSPPHTPAFLHGSNYSCHSMVQKFRHILVCLSP